MLNIYENEQVNVPISRGRYSWTREHATVMMMRWQDAVIKKYA
jgi:hypothetical protein